MRISVVVPAFNRCEMTEGCLRSLVDQSLEVGEYEIIVVDDCSTDDTPQVMQRTVRLYPGLVRYIRHYTNMGLASARNTGILAARGWLVCCLDNDNRADFDMLREHLAVHEHHKEKRVASIGNSLFAEECISGKNFGRYMQSRYLGGRNVRQRARIDYSDLPGQYFAGLNHCVRRSDLIEAGLFDTTFRFYGGEDECMGHALRDLGVRLVFAEKAKSLHFEEVSISRYKAKYLEAGREAIHRMAIAHPEYLRRTKVQWTIPRKLAGNESLSRAARRAAVSTLLGGRVVAAIEGLAVRVDSIPLAYFPFLYRLLTAGWFVAGSRAKERGYGNVSYDG